LSRKTGEERRKLASRRGKARGENSPQNLGRKERAIRTKSDLNYLGKREG